MANLASSLVYHTNADLFNQVLSEGNYKTQTWLPFLSPNPIQSNNWYHLWICINDHRSRPLIKENSTCLACIPQWFESYQVPLC